MTVLTNHQLLHNQKRKFDAKNKKDIEVFKKFMAENKWGGPCPFILEEPYLNIPHMMKEKYIRSQFDIPEPIMEMYK